MMLSPVLRLTISLLLLTLVAGSQCPDDHECGDEQTCCLVPLSGEFSCCPFHQGECCDDHVHCCPKGFLCQRDESKCSNSTHSVHWVERLPSKLPGQAGSEPLMKDPGQTTKLPESGGSVVPCNDTVGCPDGNTCCITATGDWACCPGVQSVCCDDHIHCCPHGTKCNLAAQTCEGASVSVPWMKKEPGQPITAQKLPEVTGSVVPCNETVGCPDGNTCCITATGDWACCPGVQSVCCDDHIHCCPHGTKCNLAAQTCEGASVSVPWMKKEPGQPITAQKLPEVTGSVVRCNRNMSCPDGNTCCRSASGYWACCVGVKAVCCKDHMHCCPHGTKCNLAAQTCEGRSGSVSWTKKEPGQPITAQKLPEVTGLVVPCNETVGCPDGDTCCMTTSGDWGCCAGVQAVCCEDHVHCCPHGTTCNLATQKCEGRSGSVSWTKKEPGRAIGATGRKSSMRDDSECPCSANTTCCRNKDGDWSCCPLSKGVCCKDQVHCCPHDTRCNMATLTCDASVPISVLLDTPKPKHGGVECGGGFSCQDAETCCKLSETTWGCCPSPNAVCCSDMVHCCPTGYLCGDKGSCVQAPVFDWEHWDSFVSKKKQPLVL